MAPRRLKRQRCSTKRANCSRVTPTCPARPVEFDAASEAMALISEVPTISEDGLSLTVTYDSFYVDYPYETLTPSVAAHVVGRSSAVDR